MPSACISTVCTFHVHFAFLSAAYYTTVSMRLQRAHTRPADVHTVPSHELHRLPLTEVGSYGQMRFLLAGNQMWEFPLQTEQHSVRWRTAEELCYQEDRYTLCCLSVLLQPLLFLRSRPPSDKENRNGISDSGSPLNLWHLLWFEVRLLQFKVQEKKF